jgi:hypothetical protein
LRDYWRLIEITGDWSEQQNLLDIEFRQVIEDAAITLAGVGISFQGFQAVTFILLYIEARSAGIS